MSQTRESEPDRFGITYALPARGFDWALQQLREGKKLRRSGWNGKGMYVVLQKGYPEGIPINRNTAEATGLPEGSHCVFLPYLMMKAADDRPTFVPWIISQTDALSFDWEPAE